jgi:hypothetical protein
MLQGEQPVIPNHEKCLNSMHRRSAIRIPHCRQLNSGVKQVGGEVKMKASSQGQECVPQFLRSRLYLVDLCEIMKESRLVQKREINKKVLLEDAKLHVFSVAFVHEITTYQLFPDD